MSAMTALGSATDNIDYFSALLDRPIYGPLAAKELGKIGGEAKSAVPLIIRALDNPRIKAEDHYFYIDALTSIAPSSVSVRRILLREATSDGSLSALGAASQLSEMDPLPANFAPVLVRRIESLDENDGMAYLLKQALDHTHTGLKPKPSAPPSPTVVGAPLHLVRAIESLAKQPHAVTLQEAMIQLGLDPRDYEQGQSFSARLRHPDNAGDVHVVAAVRITGILPALGYPPSTPPLMTQSITVDLLRRYCVAGNAISDGSSSKPDPQAIYVVAHRSLGTFKFKGSLPEDKFAARDNTLYLGTDCSSHIEISKSFDSDYWQSKCPFAYDVAVVKSRLIPALQSRIGPDFERYDLSKPQLKEFGRGIQLVFAIPKDQSESVSKVGPALRVSMDRCTRQIDNAWEY